MHGVGKMLRFFFHVNTKEELTYRFGRFEDDFVNGLYVKWKDYFDISLLFFFFELRKLRK